MTSYSEVLEGDCMTSYSEVLEGSLLCRILSRSREGKGEEGSGDWRSLRAKDDVGPADEMDRGDWRAAAVENCGELCEEPGRESRGEASCGSRVW